MSNDSSEWKTASASKKASSTKQKPTRGGNKAPVAGNSRGKKEESKNSQKKDVSEKNSQKKPALNWRAERDKLMAEVEKAGGLNSYLAKRNPELVKTPVQPVVKNEAPAPPAPAPARKLYSPSLS